mmetsp:Transcript_8253/g.12641  ORF Transcript_8253/g.12641 Transcript_8253/m.12641 type:complete len:131 (-) Transcript_8253:5955-6347(-)
MKQWVVGMRCKTDNTGFVMFDHDYYEGNFKYSMIKYNFGSDILRVYEFLSANNPFSNDDNFYFRGAIFGIFGGESIFDVLLYGQTENIDIGANSWSVDKNHGFLFPLNSDPCESCFTPSIPTNSDVTVTD